MQEVKVGLAVAKDISMNATVVAVIKTVGPFTSKEDIKPTECFCCWKPHFLHTSSHLNR